MPEQAHTGGGRFQTGIVIDTHVHTMDYLPLFASSVFRWTIRRTVPPPFFLDQLPSAGVDAVVAHAVGDRVATAWWVRPPWRAVQAQLCRMRKEAEDAHIELATSAAQVRSAFESGHVSVILGLEGGDGIDRRLSRLDKLYEWGVRILVPVHLRDNRIGTTRLPWQSYMRMPGMPRRRSRGLTERFLDDSEIVAIAETGGLVGLWPYHYGGYGPRDLDTLMRHARYIADLVGPAHLCIGTDINGVPGTLTGFRRENDVRLIAEYLRSAGFGADDVPGIMGGNFMRVFERAVPAS